MSHRLFRVSATAAALVLALFTAACAAEDGSAGESNAGGSSGNNSSGSSGGSESPDSPTTDDTQDGSSGDDSSGSSGSGSAGSGSSGSSGSGSGDYAFGTDREDISKAIEVAFSTQDGKVSWSGDTLTLAVSGDASSPLAGFTECRVLQELLNEGDKAIVQYPDASFECESLL